MRYSIAALALLALTACEAQPEGEPVARARIDGQEPAAAAPTPEPSATATLASQVESACRSIIFEDTPLTHCLAVPSRHRIAMDLGPEGEAPYRSRAS